MWEYVAFSTRITYLGEKLVILSIFGDIWIDCTYIYTSNWMVETGRRNLVVRRQSLAGQMWWRRRQRLAGRPAVVKAEAEAGWPADDDSRSFLSNIAKTESDSKLVFRVYRSRETF